MPFFITPHPTAPGFVFSPPFDPRFPDRLPEAARQDDWLDMSDVILDTGNLTVVSGRFREAVEALEPGIHAFHPLAMRDKAGETGFGAYFLFECGQTIPAVLSRKSGFDGRWQTDYFGRPYRGLSSAKTSGLFLSKPEIAGHHLFGNLFHGPSALVMSDELMARIEPLDYPNFIRALDLCEVVLTDSGGVQEEAPALGKPVLVMRETTERPEGVAAGTAKLVGTDAERIVSEISTLLDNKDAYQAMARAHNPFGDGQASTRIAKVVAHEFGL